MYQRWSGTGWVKEGHPELFSFDSILSISPHLVTIRAKRVTDEPTLTFSRPPGLRWLFAISVLFICKNLLINIFNFLKAILSPLRILFYHDSKICQAFLQKKIFFTVKCWFFHRKPFTIVIRNNMIRRTKDWLGRLKTLQTLWRLDSGRATADQRKHR